MKKKTDKGCDILIVCDRQEQRIAEQMNKFLSENLKKGINIQTDCNFNSCRVAIVLCSPYSINQSTVHSFCGALYYENMSKENTAEDGIVLIPICHSGLTTTELPAYLSTNQGMTIRSENSFDQEKRKKGIDWFGKSLLESLSRIVDFGGWSSEKNKKMYFSSYWDNSWNAGKENGYPNGCDGHEEEDYKTVVLTKQSSESTSIIKLNITEHSVKLLSSRKGVNGKKADLSKEKWRESIVSFRGFLHDDNIDEVRGAISIGIQPMLWDGKELFLGVRKWKNQFYHSGTVALNHQSVIEQLLQSSINTDDKYVASSVSIGDIESLGAYNNIQTTGLQKEECIRYLEKRLKSMNMKLWLVDPLGDNVKETAVITLNDSDEFPRLEIGIIRIIDISRIVGTDWQGSNAEKKKPYAVSDGFVMNFLQEDWIWAKDGKVEYWYFKKAENIEKMIYSKDISGPVFVNREIMYHKYGCCRITSPYVSDEDREGAMIAEPFTVSARTLLTCF